MDGEVVGGGAERVADDTGVFGWDVLDPEAHVRRQLAPATAAERVPDGFVQVAARAIAFLGEFRELFLGQVHGCYFHIISRDRIPGRSEEH